MKKNEKRKAPLSDSAKISASPGRPTANRAIPNLDMPTVYANLETARQQLNKRVVRSLRKGLLWQIILQVVLILMTAAGGYYLMTWITNSFLNVNLRYLEATIEVLGTLAVMTVVLVTINTQIYRRRHRELTNLANAISRVAAGDFDYRINYKKRESMSLIYEDFNRMTAELSSVQLLRTDFINQYSHEFKTPIASINGFAELLLERDIDPADQREYLQIIRDESERLSTLAQNTILLTKLSNQQIISDAAAYNLGEQLRQCAIIASHAWMEKNIDFESEIEDITYFGNKELMQHMWLNLLSNAIKYTPGGGRITVTLRESEDYITASFADTGEGMSEETKLHLFDPYYQGSSSSVQGLGLGLSIVHRIAELCRGEILVDSTLGAGSTITVRLPKNPTGIEDDADTE